MVIIFVDARGRLYPSETVDNVSQGAWTTEVFKMKTRFFFIRRLFQVLIFEKKKYSYRTYFFLRTRRRRIR